MPPSSSAARYNLRNRRGEAAVTVVRVQEEVAEPPLALPNVVRQRIIPTSGDKWGFKEEGRRRFQRRLERLREKYRELPINTCPYCGIQRYKKHMVWIRDELPEDMVEYPAETNIGDGVMEFQRREHDGVWQVMVRWCIMQACKREGCKVIMDGNGSSNELRIFGYLYRYVNHVGRRVHGTMLPISLLGPMKYEQSHRI